MLNKFYNIYTTDVKRMLKEWYSFIFLYPNSQDILNRKSKLQDNTLGKKKKSKIYVSTYIQAWKNIQKPRSIFWEGKNKGNCTYYVCKSHVNQIKLKKKDKIYFPVPVNTRTK